MFEFDDVTIFTNQLSECRSRLEVLVNPKLTLQSKKNKEKIGDLQIMIAKLEQRISLLNTGKFDAHKKERL